MQTIVPSSCSITTCFIYRALENDTNTTTPGVRKYYAANKFERLYIRLGYWITLFIILNLWKVINKSEEIEGESWSTERQNQTISRYIKFLPK